MPPIIDEVLLGWRELANPGELFLAMWDIACEWEPGDRAILPEPLIVTRNALASAVALDDGAASVNSVLDVLKQEWTAGATVDERRINAGLLLQAMRAVDFAFTPLHPRTRTLGPAFGVPARLARWLAKVGRQRLRQGEYCRVDRRRLIPNGPFSRHAKGRAASSANSLQDQFPVLTAAPTASRLEDRTIYVDMKVVGTDTMRGVPASSSIGRERVRFIPLAEQVDDLSFVCGIKGTQPVLDVRPTIDMAVRLVEALKDSKDVDLAFAPELTVCGSGEAAISVGITDLGANAPRITLAGSGLSVDAGDCGRHWNEARVFGRGGHLLWRHRKTWPFGMQQTPALSYGLDDPGNDQTLMEDIAGSSRVTVVDMDGFGRCVLFICQDIEGRPIVDEIIARYQPDWVFAPILDPGIQVPGWAHQRAVNLASKSQSRFLIGSSLTMSLLRKDTIEPAVGLAVGPSEPTVGPHGTALQKRALALVHATEGNTPRSGMLVWDYKSPVWTKSSIQSAT